MSRKIFFHALAVRMAAGLLAAGLLAGCYAYPAGYQPYGGYQVTGVYEGYPYYGGYPGAVFIGPGDYGRYHPGYFGDGWRPGVYPHGFYGHPAPGFSHAGPRNFGGAFHGGPPAAGGGTFFSHH